MQTIARFVRALLIILVIAGLLLAGGLYLLIQRTLPQTSGKLAVAGLAQAVEVIRDTWGVPHLYAQSTDDLFFAQGYVMAQDRLWQMDFNRRVAAGRLSEFGGQATLSTDVYMRTLGLYRSARADLPLLSTRERAVLESFARGVNAFIDTHRSTLPLEYTILNTVGGARIEPERWSPVDTLAWGKVMALGLSNNMSYELLRVQWQSLLGAERTAQLEPGYPQAGPFIVKQQGAALETETPPQAPLVDAGLSAALSELDAQNAIARYIAVNGSIPDRETALGFSFSAIGSNNWVVSGSKTTSGEPLLANDMHLGIQNPSIWYEVHLEAPGLRLAGLTFAGVPGIIVGHNDRIAWGCTNAFPDVQDLFIEKFNPQNGRQYEYQGAWLDAQVVREEINVKGQSEPVVKDILITRHGPIVTDVVSGTSERVALRWTALDPGTLFTSVIALWSARNWQDFRAALKDWDVPSQSFVYADVDGNIGYQMPGRVPVRAAGNGALPVPGWSGAYEWTGWIPYDSLPRAYNPPNGFVASANNRPVEYSYRYFLSNEWAPPYRAQRIEDLLAARARLSLQDMRDIQADQYSIPDKELARYLLAVQPANDSERQALEFVRQWDGRLALDSVGASIVESVVVSAMGATFGDELGKLANSYLGAGVPVLLRILPDAGNAWFDDVGTAGKETRDDILRRSLSSALADLEKRLGTDMSTWQWGRLHTATFKHQALGASKPLDRFFNIGPLPMGGGGNSATVYSASYDFRKPFDVTSISSQRAIFDLADFDRSLMLNPIGQSGQPGAKHYGDETIAWRDVTHHAFPFSRQAVEDHQEALLILTPQ